MQERVCYLVERAMYVIPSEGGCSPVAATDGPALAARICRVIGDCVVAEDSSGEQFT